MICKIAKEIVEFLDFHLGFGDSGDECDASVKVPSWCPADSRCPFLRELHDMKSYGSLAGETETPSTKI